MINENICKGGIVTLKTYKKNLKETLLLQQKNGDAVEWKNNNCVLNDILGLRQSHIQRETVDSSIFFE